MKKEIALFWHVKWKEEGSQHNTFVAHMRSKTRLQYHYAVRRIDNNNNTLKSERMAANCIKDKRDMWSEAKKMRGNSRKLPNIVDNAVGDNDISNIFLDKFNNIFTSVGYDSEEMDEIRMKIMNMIHKKKTN